MSATGLQRYCGATVPTVTAGDGAVLAADLLEHSTDLVAIEPCLVRVTDMYTPTSADRSSTAPSSMARTKSGRRRPGQRIQLRYHAHHGEYHRRRGRGLADPAAAPYRPAHAPSGRGQQLVTVHDERIPLVTPSAKVAAPAAAAINQAVRARLPVGDRQTDYDAHRGFIATIHPPAIKNTCRLP